MFQTGLLIVTPDFIIKLEEQIESLNIPIHSVVKGFSTLDLNIETELLATNKTYGLTSNAIIVFSAKYGNVRFLFPGETDTELLEQALNENKDGEG